MLNKTHKLKTWQKIIIIIILAVSFLIMFFSSRGDSLTTDEKVYITAGFEYITKGDHSYISEHPPLAMLLSGSFVKIFTKSQISQTCDGQKSDCFIYSPQNKTDKIFFWGRFPFLFIALGLFYIVFLWAWRLWGFKGGLVALILAAFCPNLLAHGRLAATDFLLAFSYFLNFYLLRKYILKPNWQNMTFLGLAMSLVLLSKFSGIIVLPLNIILVIIIFYLKKEKKILEKTGLILFSEVIAIFLVWIVYTFSMRLNLKEYWLAYQLNHYNLSWFWGFFKWLTRPIREYWIGMTIQINHNNLGHLAFLNGSFSKSGWWYYFPLAIWYKTTIPTLILLGGTIYFSIKKKFLPFWEILIIIVPPTAFLVLSMTSHLNIGLRYVLVIYPFIYLFIAGITRVDHCLVKLTLSLLVVLNLIISFLTYPHYLSYFNQFAGGTRGGTRHLADSNIDWGENIKRFKEYLESQKIDKIYFRCYDKATPTFYGIKFENPPSEPTKGIIALCAHQYIIWPKEAPEYKWFAQTPPDKVIAETIYLWEFK